MRRLLFPSKAKIPVRNWIVERIRPHYTMLITKRLSRVELCSRTFFRSGEAMKCLYYLASTLSSTHDVSDDLHEVGVKDFYLHVISKDESGLKKQHIHSSNYLETLDIVRDGFIGGALGFVVGLIGIGLLDVLRTVRRRVQVPTFVYVMLVGVATLFGAWEGGLTGIAPRTRSSRDFTMTSQPANI